MTDHRFVIELKIRAYIDQIAAYGLGHPSREYFEPVVPILKNADDSINRRGTLNLPCFRNAFNDAERQVLCDV